MVNGLLQQLQSRLIKQIVHENGVYLIGCH